MKLKAILLAALLGFALVPARASASAVVDANGRTILKVHTEYKSGAPFTIAYYVGTTEVISLSNLGSGDAQVLKKVLDDAFATGKKVTWFRNARGVPRVANWYDANDAQATITFHDYAGGEEFLIRVK
ncbi:MAG TPA: hypothetical protein VHO67_20425 [Polyangia bacterium]|nr:hypothetical protein [Polyangia bacterium]